VAAIEDWSDSQTAEWERWLADHPEVSELARRMPPNLMYRHKPTGQRVVIESYSEGGTVRMLVCGLYNAVVFDRSVFGVPADDLEECELPLPGEPLGTKLTDEADIAAHVENLKRRRASKSN
jgi:hypothetical protein